MNWVFRKAMKPMITTQKRVQGPSLRITVHHHCGPLLAPGNTQSNRRIPISSLQESTTAYVSRDLLSHLPAVPAASSGRAARAPLSLQPRPRPPPPAAVRAAPTAAAGCLYAPRPSGGGEGASGAGGGGGSGSLSHGVRQPQLSPPLLPAAATSCAAMVQFLPGRWGQESRAA